MAISDRDLPLQPADKRYYGSGVRSVIQQTVSDSPKRRKGKIKANPTPRIVDPRVSATAAGPLRSADVYYANDSRAVGAEFSGQAGAAVQANSPIAIKHHGEIADQMTVAFDRVRLGMTPVRIALANTNLVERVRQYIELATARELITEDQSSDIKLGLLPTARKAARTQPALAIPVLTDLGDPSQFAPVAGGITQAALKDAVRAVPELPPEPAFVTPAEVKEALAAETAPPVSAPVDESRTETPVEEEEEVDPTDETD